MYTEIVTYILMYYLLLVRDHALMVVAVDEALMVVVADEWLMLGEYLHLILP